MDSPRYAKIASTRERSLHRGAVNVAPRREPAERPGSRSGVKGDLRSSIVLRTGVPDRSPHYRPAGTIDGTHRGPFAPAHRERVLLEKGCWTSARSRGLVRGSRRICRSAPEAMDGRDLTAPASCSYSRRSTDAPLKTLETLRSAGRSALRTSGPSWNFHGERRS